MGCYARGDKNSMGYCVRGDKNSMGCFVRGGKSMWDVLSGCKKMAWDVLFRDVLSGSLLNSMLPTKGHREEPKFCLCLLFMSRSTIFKSYLDIPSVESVFSRVERFLLKNTTVHSISGEAQTRDPQSKFKNSTNELLKGNDLLVTSKIKTFFASPHLF